MERFSLFDEPVEIKDNKPVLLDIQLKLLERGRDLYVQGHRRCIFQGSCGSGKTIVASEQTRRAVEMNKKVMHVVHRRRLVDQMMWTLQKFGMQPAPLMAGRMSWDSKVYCASRDTLLAMLKDGVDLPRPDLLIIDECHIRWQELQDWYLKNCPNTFWTGYTATPILPDGSSMNPPYTGLISMASTSDMIRLGRLCRVKVYNPDAVGRRRRQGDKVKPVGDPVAHWLKYAKDLPTVVYAAKVSESKAIVERYRAAGVTAEHIDASTPEDEREAVFERSRTGQTKVISNVGVLIEGIDLPWLVCCQLLRGCNSLILWHQAPGRVMRTFTGKECGIVLDHAAAAHEFGLPDDDFEWSLDDARTNASKNNPPKDAKPVTCSACGFVFSRKPACPECGKVVPVRRRKSLLDGIQKGDGVLTQFTGQQQNAIGTDRLIRLFKKCYYIVKAKGGTMKMVNGMFAKEVGKPAWECDLPLNIPQYSEWQTPAKDWELNNE